MNRKAIIVGETILNSAKNIIKATNEIESIIPHFEEALKKMLENEEFIRKNNGLKEIKADKEEEWDQNEWFCIGCVWNFGLFPRNARINPKAVIALKVSLIDNSNFSGLKEPLIHVLFSNAKWDYGDFELPPVIEDGETVKLRGQRLWEWFSEGDNEKTDLDWHEREWAFSLPLVSIHTVSDIKTRICNPILALLKGWSLTKCFEFADEIIRFQFREDKLFRV